MLLVLISLGTIVAFAFKDEVLGVGFTSGLPSSDSAVIAQGEEVYAEYCASCHGAGLEGQPNRKVRDTDGFLPAPPHDATGHTWHHDDASLLEIVKQVVAAFAQIEYETNMLAFEGVLSDEKIHAVLSFIKSMWPEHIQERHDQINYREKENNVIVTSQSFRTVLLLSFLVLPFGWGTVSAQIKEPALTPIAKQGKLVFNKFCAQCHGVNAAGTDKGPPLIHKIYEPSHHADASFVRAVKQGVRPHHWRFGPMPPVKDLPDDYIPFVIQYVREMQRENGIR